MNESSLLTLHVRSTLLLSSEQSEANNHVLFEILLGI